MFLYCESGLKLINLRKEEEINVRHAVKKSEAIKLKTIFYFIKYYLIYTKHVEASEYFLKPLVLNVSTRCN